MLTEIPEENEELTDAQVSDLVSASGRILNRAHRHRKPLRPRVTVVDYIDVPENAYTKATHKIKKERPKNARTKQQRRKHAAVLRKTRKQSHTQVS